MICLVFNFFLNPVITLFWNFWLSFVELIQDLSGFIFFWTVFSRLVYSRRKYKPIKGLIHVTV